MILMYKCPQCGGEVTLDEGKRELACSHCGNRISMFESEQCESQLVEDVEMRDVWFNETIRFSCPTCGSNMICGKEDITGKCLFCGNDVIIEEQLQEEYAPDKLIPFLIDRDRARTLAEGYINTRGFELITFEPDKLVGVYVPFWLYDFCGDATIEGHNRIDHDWFKVIRKGKITLEKVPLDASIKMNNELMDGLMPYHYSQLFDFQKGALAGFYAQKYDFRYDEMQDRLRKKVEDFTNTTLRQEMEASLEDPNCVRSQKYHGSVFAIRYDEVHIKNYESKTFLSDVCYALLPVWQYDCKCEGRNYQIFINGQTGKISSNLPMTVTQAGTDVMKDAMKVFWEIMAGMFIVIPLAAFELNSWKVFFGGIAILFVVAVILAAYQKKSVGKIMKKVEKIQECVGYIMSDGFELYYGVEIPDKK